MHTVRAVAVGFMIVLTGWVPLAGSAEACIVDPMIHRCPPPYCSEGQVLAVPAGDQVIYVVERGLDFLDAVGETRVYVESNGREWLQPGGTDPLDLYAIEHCYGTDPDPDQLLR